MLRLAITVAIGSALAGPLCAQPAARSANSSPDCPLQGIPESERMLAAPVASGQLTDVPVSDEGRGRTALDIILSNVPRCAEAGRWTEYQRRLAQQYVLMQLTREDMLRRYDARNVDLRFIDEAVATAQPAVEPPFDAFVARVRAQGVGDDQPGSAGDIVYIYMMLAYQTAEIRARFADPNLRLH